MKKILAVFLALIMILSLVACGTQSGGEEQSTDITDNATESVEETTDGGVKEAPAYDGVFQAGFGRVDISPTTYPIPLATGGTMMKELHDPLYSTAIAVHDGENTVLIVTADIKNLGESDYLKLTKQIKQITGVPESNIMFSATHNHTAPTPTQAQGANTTLRKWSSQFFTKTVDACKEAIKDLADAELYVGTFKTTGMAFVRRYILEGGKFNDFLTVGDRKVVAYESEADDTAQLIRFVRKDKKDILLVNWQCHVASIGTHYPGAISADLTYLLRTEVEKDEDLLVAYYQGASGNINWQAKVSGSGKYFTYLQMGTAFGQKALEAASLDKMTKINAGKIKAERAIYSVKAKKDTEQRIADAKTVRDGGYTSELLSKYNFSHEYEVDAVLMRVGHGETIPIYLGAISFGDLSFVSVPYEMYDSNGMFVKDNSPTKMTFVLTCAGGAYAYVPSTFSSKNGGYDAYKTNFEYGTGDEVAAELVEMLKGLK